MTERVPRVNPNSEKPPAREDSVEAPLPPLDDDSEAAPLVPVARFPASVPAGEVQAAQSDVSNLSGTTQTQQSQRALPLQRENQQGSPQKQKYWRQQQEDMREK